MQMDEDYCQPTIFKHLVSACTAAHFFEQNLMPHLAQPYGATKPHTLQNFLAAVDFDGPAAAVR
jgi:hypothetical protein